MKIFVANEFSRTPGPRFKTQGQYSGEEFRDTLLIPKLEACIANGEILEVIFDGVRGAGVSFLEESFGGLIRKEFSKNVLDKCLKITWAINPRKEAIIYFYIEKAAKDAKK